MFSNNRRAVLSCAIIVAALLGLTLSPALAGQSVTVGDFVQELARNRGHQSVDAVSAINALTANGIRIPRDIRLESALTENDVVALSRAVGISVTTRNPDRVFDADRSKRFFEIFSSELIVETRNYSTEDSDGDAPPFDPFTKAKGKGKGKGGVTETNPD
ncbi:MAG: hypothetical protein OES25_11740 [Acidobacteriota bacterium]|nr:hypothetical protein [Acidobacteriota bacterium]